MDLRRDGPLSGSVEGLPVPPPDRREPRPRDGGPRRRAPRRSRQPAPGPFRTCRPRRPGSRRPGARAVVPAEARRPPPPRRPDACLRRPPGPPWPRLDGPDRAPAASAGGGNARDRRRPAGRHPSGPEPVRTSPVRRPCIEPRVPIPTAAHHRRRDETVAAGGARRGGDRHSGRLPIGRTRTFGGTEPCPRAPGRGPPRRRV